MSRVPVILSIAGSDCSGGAGMQADIKTSIALGTYCTTVVTAVTAQNFKGVKGVEYVGEKMLRLQLRSILDSIFPDAIKIGMIPCLEAAEIIKEYIESYGLTNIIVDPVITATAGGSLSNETLDSTFEIARLLYPLSTLLTPNIPEIRRLSKTNVQISSESVRELMDEYGIKNLLLKGGHSESPVCEDILYLNNGDIIAYTSPRIDSQHTHGTGCTLSTAIACGLANDKSLEDSVAQAKYIITAAIKNGAEYPVFPEYGPVHQQPPITLSRICAQGRASLP